MRIFNYKMIYFLGVGGIGMSALARYFNHYKIKVAGYDKTETVLTKELAKEGIEIHYSEDVELLKKHLAGLNDRRSSYCIHSCSSKRAQRVCVFT
jgi:UDP-N-acetylmuramate--alanine ligase